MKHSFVKRTMIFFIIICIIPFLVFSFIFFDKTTELEEKQMKESLSALVKEKASTLQYDLIRVENETINLAQWAGYSLEKPYDGKEISKEYARDEKGVLGRKIQFAEGKSNIYLPSNIELTNKISGEINNTQDLDLPMASILSKNKDVDFAYITTSNGLLRVYPYLENSTFTPEHDQRKDYFYTRVMENKDPNKKALWTNPYYDYGGNGWVITCSSPIFVNKQFRGVACVDVSLKTIAKSIADFRIGDSGFAFVISDQGEVIYHPEMMKISSITGNQFKSNILDQRNTSQAYKNIIQGMMAKKHGIKTYTSSKNEDRIIAFAPIKTLNWSIGIEVNKSEYVVGNGYLTIKFWLLIMILLILCLIMASRLSLKVTAPIKALTVDVQKMADGEFGQVIVDSQDEIGLLGQAFNKMSRKITEQMMLEREFLQSEKMAGVGQMAAGVTHELKNPLAIIKGAVYLLKANLGNEEKEKEALNEITSSVNRAENIIYNMLDFSKTSKGMKGQANVKSLLQQIMLLVRQDIVKRKINMILKLDEEPLYIYGDSDSFKHIFLNLITNAIDAMPNGGELVIHARKLEGKNTEISFGNTGETIPDENLEKIFQPFFTTKENGTGLGLWIVANEVARNGGTIKAYNDGLVMMKVVLPEEGNSIETNIVN